MRIHLFGCSVAVVLGAAGCSIHPLPDDFPRASTVAIVQQIRCEAYHAVEKLRKVNRKVYEQEKLDDAAIAYRFHFTITEKNGAEGGAGFKLPLTHGTFSLGIDAGSERERVGERELTVTEYFKDIRCQDELQAASENFRYPITGNIGLEETIFTFATLAGLKLIDPPQANKDQTQRSTGGQTGHRQDGGRGRKGGSSRNAKKGGKPVDFTDALTFTTTIGGGLAPKIELNPVGSGFALAEAQAAFSGERTDKHEVVVALELPPTATPGKKERTRRGAQFAPVPIEEEDAKGRALQALDRQRALSTHRDILDQLRRLD